LFAFSKTKTKISILFLSLRVSKGQYRTERESVDVNITPDKRQVLLQNERFLCALLKKSLTALYESSPACLPLAPNPLQGG
jgi:DNA mismatch repair ATPase MutL